MNLFDYMEVVVVDKNGAHEIKTKKDIDEYLGDKNELKK